jgi:hypothetical protein
MTGFLASALSEAGDAALDFEEASLGSFGEEDLEVPRAPETVPAREAREGALDAEALEPAPLEADDLDVGTLESMKILENTGSSISGHNTDIRRLIGLNVIKLIKNSFDKRKRIYTIDDSVRKIIDDFDN